MATEDIKAINRSWIETGWNAHDPTVIDDFSMPDFVLHGFVASREEWRAFVTSFLEAFPDVRVTVEDQLAEGDKVLTRWRMSGTHRGEYAGIDATGNRMEIRGMNVSRYEDGKCVEDWGNWDEKGLLDQLTG